MRRLNDYITFTMALDMLHVPHNHTTRVHRLIRKHDLEVVSIGHMKLLDRQSFASAAGIPALDASERWRGRWPVHIAILEMDDIIDAKEAAEILDTSIRNVYYLLSNNTLQGWDLSHWGGQRIVSKWSVQLERARRDKEALALILKRTPRWNKHVDADIQ